MTNDGIATISFDWNDEEQRDAIREAANNYEL